MIYSIKKEPFGLRVTFDGMMNEESSKSFSKEFLDILTTINGNVSILIDLRKGKPISPEAQAIVNDCYYAVIKKGLVRSANIVSSSIMKMQMIRRAKELGTYDKARYIDASLNENCEQIALDWIEKGIDPDKLFN